MTQELKYVSPEEDVSLVRIDQVYESLRFNDYLAQNGIGEIVDNSIEARAANIEVRFTVEKAQKTGKKKRSNKITEIAVIDDGIGMDAGTVHRCLVLGESIRVSKDGRRGIGRFGVGMTLGGISLARRMEVFSRTHGNDWFLYTFVDLDDIQQRRLNCVPVPIPREPPKEYGELLKDSSGTIVILKDCDRVNGDLEGLSNYLGRTYRKFIERGIKIKLNGELVYLHDPLYLSGPTVFDSQKLKEEGIGDPKATLLGENRISLDIPDSPGKTADVVIRMSLLPKEWRMEAGAGGGAEAKKRKIDQNEGVSILRADREVRYAHIPYITGKRGVARSLDIDRWWGCEISFPPELDSYFQIKYIKRGAEPVPSLRNQIREVISATVKTARSIIREDWAKEQAAREAKTGFFEKAEKAMASAEWNLPQGRQGKNLTAKENETKLDALASAALGAEKNNSDQKEQKKTEIREKPYSIELVSNSETILFETVHLLDNIVIQLNVNHPFYEKILQPLCGDFEEDAEEGLASQQFRQDVKNAVLLLLFSYAKAESMFEDHQGWLANLRTFWGVALKSALNEYDRKDSPS